MKPAAKAPRVKRKPALWLPLVKRAEMIDASVPNTKKSYHSKAVPAAEAATTIEVFTPPSGGAEASAMPQGFFAASGYRRSLITRQLFMSAMNRVSSVGQAMACGQLNCPIRLPDDPRMPRILPSSVILYRRPGSASMTHRYCGVVGEMHMVQGSVWSGRVEGSFGRLPNTG